jgi:hypothetical protein
MILLNYRSALGRLTLFNHGSTVPIPISVEIPVTLAYGYASAYGADADANTNLFSQCRCSQCHHGRDYQRVLHHNLLSLFCTWKVNPRKGGRFPESSRLSEELYWNWIGGLIWPPSLLHWPVGYKRLVLR